MTADQTRPLFLFLSSFCELRDGRGRNDQDYFTWWEFWSGKILSNTSSAALPDVHIPAEEYFDSCVVEHESVKISRGVKIEREQYHETHMQCSSHEKLNCISHHLSVPNNHSKSHT